jgi:hypothetical protein
MTMKKRGAVDSLHAGWPYFQKRFQDKKPGVHFNASSL